MLVNRFFFWYTSSLRKSGNECQVQNFILCLLRHLLFFFYTPMTLFFNFFLSFNFYFILLYNTYLESTLLNTLLKQYPPWLLTEYLTSPNNIYPNWYIWYVVDLWLFISVPSPCQNLSSKKRGASFEWLLARQWSKTSHFLVRLMLRQKQKPLQEMR